MSSSDNVPTATPIHRLFSMPFDKPQRLTRRRSSAGPVPPRRPLESSHGHRQSPRPTFLTLRDHGKVFVADMPHLSDGQLSHIHKEADEVFTSLEPVSYTHLRAHET